MKNIQNIIFSALLLLILFGCEQTVFINQNGYEPRVAVESDIAADSLPKIYLTETQNYYGYVDFQKPAKYIENAKVLLIHNGTTDELSLTEGKTDTMFYYTGNGTMDTVYTKRKYYLGHTPCKKGETYQLNISHNGKEITSELTVTNFTFTPLQAEQKIEQINYPGGSYEDRFLEVRIQDPAGLGAYYRSKISYSYMDYIQIYDPNTGQYSLDSVMRYRTEISQIVNDEVNDGGTIKMRSYPSIYPMGMEDTGYVAINIQVECLDNATGKYFESIFSQQISNGDPFTEPTLLYSNIKNGVGFFGAYQIADKSVFQYKKKWY